MKIHRSRCCRFTRTAGSPSRSTALGTETSSLPTYRRTERRTSAPAARLGPRRFAAARNAERQRTHQQHGRPRRTTSKLGMIICGCCVPIHPVIDGAAILTSDQRRRHDRFRFSSSGMRIVGRGDLRWVHGPVAARSSPRPNLGAPRRVLFPCADGEHCSKFCYVSLLAK